MSIVFIGIYNIFIISVLISFLINFSMCSYTRCILVHVHNVCQNLTQNLFFIELRM